MRRATDVSWQAHREGANEDRRASPLEKNRGRSQEAE
jgi:hypothetical protein